MYSCLNQALEQNFSRLRKSKRRVSYRHICFQISAGIPKLPGALPSFAALMASNSSLNSCFSSRHAMFTGQQIELYHETRRRNRSARHQYNYTRWICWGLQKHGCMWKVVKWQLESFVGIGSKTRLFEHYFTSFECIDVTFVALKLLRATKVTSMHSNDVK